MATVDPPNTPIAYPATEGAPGRDRRAWTRDILDFEAGRSPVPVLDDAGIRSLLAERPRIAIVGASADPFRPSHGVLLDLIALGFDVVPVHPGLEQVAGRRCHPTLAAAAAAEGPIDIVDVFRIPPACPAHAREAVEIGARCLWLQLGIVSFEAGQIAHEGGLSIVMNRCLAVDAARLTRA